MEKNMINFRPEYATYEVREFQLPIKTETGWGTITCKHKVCTGWEEPVREEK
jgi:hypothetical protein